uniref:Uncharacterized protein n=1 Tax=Pseudonaja textilis TaxID=8673 RepID=A0A670ZJZ6_PSETE
MKILLLLCCCFLPEVILSSSHDNAHRPYNITWTIKDAYGQILSSTTNYTMIFSYFPKLHFDFAEMILGKAAYSHPTDAPFPSHSIVKRHYLYVCPGHITDADHIYTCGGISDYYCKSWSCVSTGYISWTPPLKNDLITLTRTTQDIQCTTGNKKWSRCNPVTVSFTTEGKRSNIWDTGAKWGGRIYAYWPGYHYGNVFYIQRHVHVSPSLSVGPNANQIQSEFLKPLTNAQNPLVSLVASAHALLNHSQDSSISQHCWLCLSSNPPFYEVAVLATYLLIIHNTALMPPTDTNCCFYADSSGVVLDSMKELDTRFKERERERASQHTWYQGLFNLSPWLTTLLSAIAGPLILLLLDLDWT